MCLSCSLYVLWGVCIALSIHREKHGEDSFPSSFLSLLVSTV